MSRKAKGPRLPVRPGERRRKAILDAAYTLFVTRGYESVSLDDILAISGGSKSTVYKFFGNKRGVLTAVTECLAGKVTEQMSVPPTQGETIRESLKRMGMSVGRLVMSETAISQFQLAIRNLTVDPELSRIWYEHGPTKGFSGFSEYLRREAQAGRLKVKDPDRAAQLFLGMISFKDNLRMLVGGAPPTEAELEELVEEAVDVFLAAYRG